MKITCNREKLLQAFQTVAGVAPSRSPKPILQNVKIEVTNEKTSFLATDMEVSMRIDVEGVEVDEAGSALLSVARFGQILREVNDEVLKIETGSKGVTVLGQRSKFQLPSGDADEFPTIAPFDAEAYYEIPARLLKELIRRTVFSTDIESSRYALGGVLFEFEEEKLITVGTDGRRLAKMEGPITKMGEIPETDAMTIVPTRSLQIIERALHDDEAIINIAVRANDIIVSTESVTIISRLVEGRFPKWRDVFPKRDDGVRIELTVGPIASAVRQAAIVASNESRGIDLTFGGGTLLLVASTAEVGDSHIELPITYDGPNICVALDHRFVSEFLKVLDIDKTFTLDVKDSDAAALFTTDDGYGYVVMPLARDNK